MALTVHRAERSDRLVTALGELLAAPPEGADPFLADVVAVPSRGVERWLAQRLSHRLGGGDAGDGVCANVRFPSYVELLDDAVAAVDAGYAESAERWAPRRVVWPLMDAIDRSLGEPWCAGLAAHLATEGRRYSVAARLADRFARYGRARPELVRAWADGRDEQGDGQPLPPDLVWQAELWRLVRAALDLPAPAERLDAACAALRANTAAGRLPPRFSVFGATRIAPARVAVLVALAERRDVHLWLHHPSPALWRAVAERPAVRRRRDDAVTVANPLLASMSRDVRELQQLLGAAAPAARDEHHPIGARPPSLLGRLQDELAADRVPAVRTRLDPTDRSVGVHACHGPARQVEVLREVVLGLLAEDATLEPRDIVIMCPDVETFAPLIAAAFGLPETPDGHPAARLRVRVADRSLRQTNPLLSLLGLVLDLGASRVTATDVLDLAGTAPVRRRFGFTTDDLERLRDWTLASGAHWGIGRDDRARFGLGALRQGTWGAAVDRVLLGVVMEERDGDRVRRLGDVVPVDDVDSADIDLAGRLAELVDRIENVLISLAVPRTVPEWAELLADLTLALGAPTQEWQETQLRRELADVAESAGAGDTVRVGLADIAALLRDQLAGRPTRAGFRTGTLTVCTLVPMRSVPHRVVCLLGMDDGAFPRHTASDGDDVLLRDPWLGERDARSEDRQLFLDAIGAATERLVITYTGADPRTGAEVPPCVPLGELLDAVDATASAPDGGRARDHVVVRHPLQPFDRRNFEAGSLCGDRPFSFDPVALAGARAASGPRTPERPLVGGTLPAEPDDVVELDDLVRFVQHPARAYLRQRLGLSLFEAGDDPADAVPVTPNSLAEWAIGDRVLRQCLAGMPTEECVRVEHLRGELPPDPLGRPVLRRIGRNVTALLAACESERTVEPVSYDVAINLPGGRSLAGTVAGVRENTLLQMGYSRLQPRHRLEGWVRYLALVAAWPDRAWRAVLVGRGRDGVSRSVLAGVSAEQATAWLADLVALRDENLRAPLPIATSTTAKYAARRTDNGVFAWLDREWAGGNYPERDDAAYVLVYGDAAPLGALTDAPDASDPRETTRFGVLARRLWDPLLAHERMES